MSQYNYMISIVRLYALILLCCRALIFDLLCSLANLCLVLYKFKVGILTSYVTKVFIRFVPVIKMSTNQSTVIFYIILISFCSCVHSQLNPSDYASIMLNTFKDLLCSKLLCWHNSPGTIYSQSQSRIAFFISKAPAKFQKYIYIMYVQILVQAIVYILPHGITGNCII